MKSESTCDADAFTPHPPSPSLCTTIPASSGPPPRLAPVNDWVRPRIHSRRTIQRTAAAVQHERERNLRLAHPPPARRRGRGPSVALARGSIQIRVCICFALDIGPERLALRLRPAAAAAPDRLVGRLDGLPPALPGGYGPGSDRRSNSSSRDSSARDRAGKSSSGTGEQPERWRPAQPWPWAQRRRARARAAAQRERSCSSRRSELGGARATKAATAAQRSFERLGARCAARLRVRPGSARCAG